MRGKWITFKSWDDSFSLQYPADWEALNQPLTPGASLSCIGPRGDTLLEAYGAEQDPVPEGATPDLVTILGQALVKSLKHEEGHGRVRVVSRKDVAFRDADRCQRMVVSYKDRGLETTTAYCIVARAGRAVIIAMKGLSSDYASFSRVFEEVLETLRAPWLAEPER